MSSIFLGTVSSTLDIYFDKMPGNSVTLEEVKTAINVLYKGADVSKKDEASRWLEHFQHSVS